jgi:F0F1-type ATP synthase assembly protein I
VKKVISFGLVAYSYFFRAGSLLPQTGHTFSLGLIIRSALHLGHLTGWSLTRLISTGELFLRVFFRLLFGMGFLAVERD